MILFFFFWSTLIYYDNFKNIGKLQVHRNTDGWKREFTPSSSFV